MPPSRIPPELEREMPLAVRAFVEAILATIDELQAKVERLERELGKRNKFERGGPDAPPKSPPPARPPSARKPGGQPGHPRAERMLIPSEQCQEVIPCRPEACRGCGAKLSGQDKTPLRHQVTDIPEIKPFVIEYQRHRLTCACCGVTTCGELPRGVPPACRGCGWWRWRHS